MESCDQRGPKYEEGEYYQSNYQSMQQEVVANANKESSRSMGILGQDPIDLHHDRVVLCSKRT